MKKLTRYHIVAPDDGYESGWDIEQSKHGDMVYYDDVKELERENKELVAMAKDAVDVATAVKNGERSGYQIEARLNRLHATIAKAEEE